MSWGKHKTERGRKNIAIPIQTFASARFASVHCACSLSSLKKNQLQIAAHAEDASRPTRDENKQTTNEKDMQDAPDFECADCTLEWSARLKRGAVTSSRTVAFRVILLYCFPYLISSTKGGRRASDIFFCLAAGGGAQRIDGPDQPRPTGPQMIVADRFLFLQATTPTSLR